MPEEQDRGCIRQASDREKLLCVVFDLQIVEQLVSRERRDDDRERRPILWSDVIEIVGCDHTAATRHVARDDCRIAGKVPAEMPR
jgi:hypothetical protein